MLRRSGKRARMKWLPCQSPKLEAYLGHSLVWSHLSPTLAQARPRPDLRVAHQHPTPPVARPRLLPRRHQPAPLHPGRAVVARLVAHHGRPRRHEHPCDQPSPRRPARCGTLWARATRTACTCRRRWAAPTTLPAPTCRQAPTTTTRCKPVGLEWTVAAESIADMEPRQAVDTMVEIIRLHRVG